MGGIDQHFNKSSDGINWEPVNPENEVPYRGGISEIGWAFDLEGNIWGVGRNEDGDDSGWGSRIFSAPAGDLSDWTWTEGTGINESLVLISENQFYIRANCDSKLGKIRSRDL